MRIGIVAEGATDFLVLESILLRVFGGETRFRELQPDLSRSLDVGGWTEMKRWCVANAGAVDTVMGLIQGDELDLLVLHVDLDVAEEVLGRDCDCPPVGCGPDLRAAIAQWLGGLPGYAVIATPAQNTEAWVVAACLPAERAAALECDPAVSEKLIGFQMLRRKKGKADKNRMRYAPLAEKVGQEFDLVCMTCSEADGFRVRLAQAGRFNVPPAGASASPQAPAQI